MALNVSTAAPTAAQQARFTAIKESGCICCRLMGIGNVQPDINHIVAGGKRLGHDFTFGLCKWHHVGWLKDRFTAKDMTDSYGPSLAGGSKTFHLHFGSDQSLLVYQNKLINLDVSFAEILPSIRPRTPYRRPKKINERRA